MQTINFTLIYHRKYNSILKCQSLNLYFPSFAIQTIHQTTLFFFLQISPLIKYFNLNQSINIFTIQVNSYFQVLLCFYHSAQSTRHTYADIQNPQFLIYSFSYKEERNPPSTCIFQFHKAIGDSLLHISLSLSFLLICCNIWSLTFYKSPNLACQPLSHTTYLSCRRSFLSAKITPTTHCALYHPLFLLLYMVIISPNLWKQGIFAKESKLPTNYTELLYCEHLTSSIVGLFSTPSIFLFCLFGLLLYGFVRRLTVNVFFFFFSSKIAS